MGFVSMEDVRTFIIKYLSEKNPKVELKEKHVDDSFDFLQAGIIDSLGVIEMISSMEKHFKISVDFEQLDPESFSLLGSFSRYIAQNAVSHAG